MKKQKRAVEAKFDAQKIAFGPVVFQAVRCMREFGMLKRLLEAGDDGLTMPALAKASGVSEYGTRVLLNIAVDMEVVDLEGDRYILTKTGYFLQNDYLTRVNMDFTHDVCYEGLFRLKESIENGKPEGLKVFGTWPTIYEGLSQLPPKVQESWFGFDHYYSDVVFPDALPVVFAAPVRRLLDVGGNTGKWTLACLQYNPEVEVTIMDLPGQLDMAEKNIASKGFAGRARFFANNLLDPNNPFPTGFDAIWMSQFLDCFSEAEILHILTRACQSMSPQASLFILEPFFNCQKYPASTFSLNATSLYFTAMANGNSQMYHSQQMIDLVHKAGMKVVKQTDHLGVSHTLLQCQRR